MSFKSIFALNCVLLCFNSLLVSANKQELETYIVHVELPDLQLSTASSIEVGETLESRYRAFIPALTASSSSNEVSSSLVYSYHNIFKGFAAKLSLEQVKEMEKISGFISARPQQIFSFQTTHSPSFLGLHQNTGFWKQSNYGNGVIIGVLDSGIDPNHPSFGDEEMPPPPAKWKGKCEFNTTTTTVCNNKLIGARFFKSGNGSPMDENGHGTHTASTAAGNFVRGANAFGNANGTAVGIAPRAHLAVYKPCSSSGCPESDILAAMDAAIDDGVDIISFSIAGRSMPFYSDDFAISAYSAMQKGIFVSCAAGNFGSSSTTLANEAPWLLTVGASTIDRKIRATAMLGNNEEFEGEYLYQPNGFPPTQFPLFYPGMNTKDNSKYCSSKLIDNIKVQGKMVVCVVGGKVPRGEKGKNVKAAGGVGMILVNEEVYGYTTLAEVHVLTAIHLSYSDGLKILSYINSEISPTASILFKGTIIGDKNAPVVAGFSSRGPSKASPGILKPDIIGPGVNILAAWNRSVEGKPDTKSNFNVISGTSMSCPHLSGVAALLKSVHPHWSPAAIKSAMMTTADVLNLAQNSIEDHKLLPADAYTTGSGHVNPAKASDPGLIYDIKPEDYIPYLCGLNYTNQQVSSIVQRKVECHSRIAEAQLNYPSFSITFGATFQRYTRTVTNVGEASSSYTIKVVPPLGVHVEVRPKTLKFSRLDQKLTYEVTLRRLSTPPKSNVSQGYLAWISTKYTVKSPIVAIMGAMKHAGSDAETLLLSTY